MSKYDHEDVGPSKAAPAELEQRLLEINNWTLAELLVACRLDRDSALPEGDVQLECGCGAFWVARPRRWSSDVLGPSCSNCLQWEWVTECSDEAPLEDVDEPLIDDRRRMSVVGRGPLDFSASKLHALATSHGLRGGFNRGDVLLPRPGELVG